MDTLFLCPQIKNFKDVKFLEKLIDTSFICFLIISQSLFPLFASDGYKVAQSVIPLRAGNIEQIKEKVMYELSEQKRKEDFDKDVINKYPNAVISDVTDGVKHIKLTKYYAGKPVRINVVEVNQRIAKNLELTPALSSDTNLKSRTKISSIAKNNNAVVALNGTYFKPQTGVPLGALMIDKKIYTGPIYDRVAIGIFDDGFDIARIQLNAAIEGSGITVKVDNINQPRILSTYVLVYTGEWGKLSPYAPKYGMNLLVENGKITKASANPIEIGKDSFVISGPKNLLQPLLIKKDAKLSIKTIPEWNGVKDIISGGPYLVKDGEVFVDMTAQKLGSIGGRNPRSAIGYTSQNNLILVAVDGREGSSIGMTLTELAAFMRSIGCVNAMNLDGGGSTVMYVNGQIVNKPNVTGGIPISNAIVLSKTTD